MSIWRVLVSPLLKPNILSFSRQTRPFAGHSASEPSSVMPSANGPENSSATLLKPHTQTSPVVGEDYMEFGSFARCKKVETNNKKPSVPISTSYLKTPFNRFCFPLILSILFLILIALLIALIFSLRFIIIPHNNVPNLSHGNASWNVILQNQTNVTYANNNYFNHSNNLSSSSSTKKYSIKVSLYEEFKGIQNDTKPMVDHSKLPLTNLTQMCMNLKGPCWYHPKKYPNSCQKAFCESVEFNLVWNSSAAAINFHPVNEVFEISPVQDRTPCGPSSWCINGQCTETNDTRVFTWSKVPPVNGAWENNCEKPKCLNNGFSRKSDWKLLLMAAKCPGMPCSAYTTELRRLQFKSCTSPLPSHDGAGCDPKELPVVWGPICQECPALVAGYEQRRLYPNEVLHGICDYGGKFLDAQRCSCVRSNGQVERVDEGAPCRAKLNESHTEPGHCFFGICLSYVGFKTLCTSY